MRGRFVVGAVSAMIVVAANAAFAAEQGVIRARLQLDRVEQRIKGLTKLDARNANTFLKQIERANTYLKGCKKRDDPEWQKQAQRSVALDKRIRELAGAPAPAGSPAPQGSPRPTTNQPVLPDGVTRKAETRILELERDVKNMAAGDRAEATRLITKLNEAIALLNQSQRGASDLWQDCQKRAKALDARIRARLAEGGGAKPAEKAPAKGEPRAFTPIPRPRVLYKAQGEGVDELRWPHAVKLVPEIEKLVEKGELLRAKQLLWALWAQTLSKGHYYQFSRTDTLALYQRARDIVYGSAPVMRTDDGAVEAATQIQFARAALKGGNLTTGTQVTAHLEGLVREGLTLSPEITKAWDALKREQAAAWKAGNEALRGVGMDVARAGAARGDLSLGDRINALASDMRWVKKIGAELPNNRQSTQMMRKCEPLLFTVRKDLEAARKVWPTFAAAPIDPEFAQIWFDSAIKQQPEFANNFQWFVSALLGAAFGQEVLDEIGIEREFNRIYRAVVESCLGRAEKAYQRDKTAQAQGELKAAQAWLEHAQKNGLPDAHAAQLKGRMEEVKGSAGVGKLKRAKTILDQVQKSLASATAMGSFDYCEKQLETAQGWIEEAKKGGVAGGDLAQIEKRYADLKGPTWTKALRKLADQPLETAEEYIGTARKHLANAEQAFDALNPIWHAEKRITLAEPFFNRLADPGAKQAVEARIAKIRAAVSEIRKQVEQDQRLPKDVYAGGGSWRGQFRRLAASEQGAKVLALTICDADWVEKTASWEYPGSGNTRIRETRWYKQLGAWVAFESADDPAKVDLRYVGFRLHKMTDGSYRMLKVYRVGEPCPMLKKNLP